MDRQSSVTFKLEISEKGENGEEPAEMEFRQWCNLFGLKPEDYGATFTYGGKTFKLVEICPTRPKYPFVGENAQGKRYKLGRLNAKLIRP